MKAGLLVALLLSAVPMIGGCTQEEESSAPEGSREETTEETSAEPTASERTVIKETTVVVPAPAPSPEAQQVAGSEPAASEIDIPHDGTVVPCYQDPVCSSEQARIQSEWTQGHHTIAEQVQEQVQEEEARIQQEAQEARQKIEEAAQKVHEQVERPVGT